MEEPSLDIELIERMKEPEPELLRDAPEGEIRGLVFWPDERLTQPSEVVPPDFFGEQLDKLVSDMVTTMYMCGGMGLSAVQVGVPLRVFVCDITVNATPAQARKAGNQLLVAVNPVVVVEKGTKEVGHREGCLSFPGVNEVAFRPDDIAIRARDRKGDIYTLRTGGLHGRVIQHEMDHLDGKTFLDHMKPMAKKAAQEAIKRFHKGVATDTIRVASKPKNPPKAAVRKKAKAARKKKKGKRR